MKSMDKNEEKVSMAQKMIATHKKKAAEKKSALVSEISLEDAIRENEKKKKHTRHSSGNKNRNDKSSDRKSIAEQIITSEKADMLIRRSYQFVKKTLISDEPSPKKEKKSQTDNIKISTKDGYTQDMVPVKAISNGIILTTSGMYVKILEVLPIDFKNMSLDECDRSANYFASILKADIARIRIKCITDKSNPARLINYIHQQIQLEEEQRGLSPKVKECADDLIRKIQYISNNSSLSKRYFISFRYEGNSTEIEEIIDDINTTTQSICSSLKNAGNSVINMIYQPGSLDQEEILYYFFNRNTCRHESLSDRITRIDNDMSLYNKMNHTKKVASVADYLAPKGLDMTHKEYLLIDGCYKTYLFIKSNGHPHSALPGWLEELTNIGAGTELDIYAQKLPREVIAETASQLAKFSRISAKEAYANPEKQNKYISRYAELNEIKAHMNQGEDIYNVVIIITLSASTVKSLKQLKTIIYRHLTKSGFYCEDAYANIMDYYYATLPLMEMPQKIFQRNKRNYLTSSVESLYLFSSIEYTDPKGFVLGEKEDNSSIVTLDLFNTTLFSNANMSFFGMPGSGKTYTAYIIARAIRLSGKRVFMILPVKPHEAYRGCKAIDGSYIKIGPGLDSRINICAILPEQNIDKNILIDTDGYVKKSLLSKQINYLLTWIKLNMSDFSLTQDESDLMHDELYNLYKDFGITDDNSSIYDETGNLKIMPIISDIYDRFADFPELMRVNKALKKYISGSCSNMNGQTNVDLTNKFICFDVDQDSIPEELMPAFLFLIVKCVYDLVKQNRLYLDVVFIDEIWNLLMHPEAGKQIKDMVKVIRGYGGSIVPITQDINDYIDDPNGKAILSGSALKFIMHLEPPEAIKAGEQLGLSKNDIKTIIGLQKGQGLLLTSKIKTVVNVIPSAKEDFEFTTDPVKRRQYALMEQQDSD